MNSVSHSPLPDLGHAGVPEPPRKKSVPPPLPRPAPRRIDPQHDLPAASAAGASLNPVTTGAVEPHHRLSTWATLVLVGGAALLLTPMVIGSHRQSEEPSLPGGIPASQSRAAPSHQVVELDEVLIMGALYEGVLESDGGRQ